MFNHQLLSTDGGFQILGVLSTLSAMGIQTLHSILTATWEKIIKEKPYFLNITVLSMRKLKGKAKRELCSSFVREAYKSQQNSQAQGGACTFLGESSNPWSKHLLRCENSDLSVAAASTEGVSWWTVVVLVHQEEQQDPAVSCILWNLAP